MHNPYVCLDTYMDMINMAHSNQFEYIDPDEEGRERRRILTAYLNKRSFEPQKGIRAQDIIVTGTIGKNPYVL